MSVLVAVWTRKIKASLQNLCGFCVVSICQRGNPDIRQFGKGFGGGVPRSGRQIPRTDGILRKIESIKARVSPMLSSNSKSFGSAGRKRQLSTCPTLPRKAFKKKTSKLLPDIPRNSGARATQISLTNSARMTFCRIIPCMALDGAKRQQSKCSLSLER